MGFWSLISSVGIVWAIGGPLGALINSIGEALFGRERNRGDGEVATRATSAAEREMAFTAGLIALCAKMARADGVVTADEVAAFKRIVEVSPADERRVEALFNLAKQTTIGFEAYASQIRDLFHNDPLLIDVMDGLFYVSKADGVVHERELAYLQSVAEIFGFDEKTYAQIEARHVRRRDDPYVVLGADRGWSHEQLRKQYLKMVKENHPDRSVAAGLPAEAISIATARLAAINAAWETISSARGKDQASLS